ncbi:helix-turn-helix domain-containing protein [Mesorhizobium sp. M1409]|uniref:XRE family transcriptional regulator n=1 Tax=unclassified Mesorhizobium TaxID=325217 RepID=UPI00333843FA
MDAPGCGNIFGDFGGSDRDCALAKADIASRIILAMESSRLMDEEAAALTGLERDQMRCIIRGRVVDGISAERMQAALEALEIWQRARAFIAG